MLRTALCVAVALTVSVTAAQADTVEVKLLNRSDSGAMVFDPALVTIQPGDSVRFVPTHKSHNAATIDGLIPPGATPFKGPISEEITVPFPVPGVYGIKCSPHYAMGMVMVVRVGPPAVVPEGEVPQDIPARAKDRLLPLLEQAGR